VVSTTNVKNNNVKINFITKLKFKIVIIVKRKLGNPVLIFFSVSEIFVSFSFIVVYEMNGFFVHPNKL
jgi:hypothetical protein